MVWRQVTVAGAVVVVMSLAACGGSSPSVSSPTTTPSLRQALARVADTPGNRSQIYYDDTSALVKLAGRNLGDTAGFALLRGSGAEGLLPLAQVITSQPGIELLGAEYTITAGSPPSQVGLLAGGQPGGSITGNLTKVGWRQQGNTLVGPSPLSAGGDQQETAILALNLARVRTSGSDVTYGGASADLDQIGSPSGRTLAQDPVVDAAAQCLGDVVAAEIMAPYQGGRKPTVLAVGIRHPASNTDKPHAVVCVGWPDQNAADKYVTAVKQQLTSGLSIATNSRYDALLRNPSVQNVGGNQHLVRWEADTPGDVRRAFTMAERIDLPALPNCGEFDRLPIAARQQLDGACP
jgi:hypothetical protein